MINNPFNIKNFYILLLLQPQVICIQTALRAITLSAILHTHSKKAKNHYLIARCSFPIASYPFIIGKPFQQPIFQSQRTTNSVLLYLIFYNYFSWYSPNCLNILVLFLVVLVLLVLRSFCVSALELNYFAFFPCFSSP